MRTGQAQDLVGKHPSDGDERTLAAVAAVLRASGYGPLRRLHCHVRRFMASRFGPLEVTGDAPPYAIVRSCRLAGFRAPEDVRWCRLSHVRHQDDEGWDMLTGTVWELAPGRGAAKEKTCTCGRALPRQGWREAVAAWRWE